MTMDLRVSDSLSNETIFEATKVILDKLIHMLNTETILPEDVSDYCDGIVVEVTKQFPEISNEDAVNMVVQGTLMLTLYSLDQHMKERENVTFH